MSELGQISNELQNEPETLRKSILSGLAKTQWLNLITGTNAFQRDQARLDARQRAIYRKQGLDVGDDETITNLLADNITITKDEKPNGRGVNPWLAALLATGAAGLGAGASHYLMRPPENPPAHVIPDQDIGYRIELE